MSDSATVERKWLHVNTPHSKDLAHMIGNFKDWSKKPLSSPFTSIKKLSKSEDQQRIKERARVQNSYKESKPGL